MLGAEVSEAWRKVWEQRRVVGLTLGLEDLISADGFNTAFGALTVEAWTAFVTRTCKSLELGVGDSLFDVGCGSGAFVFLPHQQGIAVGGADYSGALIEIARRAMPDGQFSVCEANQIDIVPTFDVVMSCFAFSYFNSLDYRVK